MKHLKILLTICIACLLSCSENSSFEETSNNIEFRSNAVSICHFSDDGIFQNIQVSSSAVSAHLAHGDYLSGSDGYCYTCTHCDIDKITQYDWIAYFDSDELSCTDYTGTSIWTDLFLPDGSARGVGAIEFPEYDLKMVLSWFEGGEYCQKLVGADISEEEWENCRNFLRSVAASRPDTPELCDVLSEQFSQETHDLKEITKTTYLIRASIFNKLPN